jgi:hypothetical protein
MSEFRELMADVVDDRAPGTTDVIIRLKNGAKFRGEIEPIQDIELITELGSDPRASHWLHISQRVPQNLCAGEELSALGKKFQVLPKVSPRNTANVMDKYLLMELTAKDET